MAKRPENEQFPPDPDQATLSRLSGSIGEGTRRHRERMARLYSRSTLIKWRHGKPENNGGRPR